MSQPENTNVVHLYGCAHLPTALRNLADDLESGEFGEVDQATLVMPGACEIFHFGAPPYDQSAGMVAMFNMQCGVSKIANGVID